MRGHRLDAALAVLREGIARTGSEHLKALLAGYATDETEREALVAQLEAPAARATYLALRVGRLGRAAPAAVGEVRELHRLHPDDPRVQNAWFWTAFAAAQLGLAPDLDLRGETAAVAEARIAEDPSAVLGHWMKAQLLLLTRSWHDVLAATERALELFPDEETMMFLRGRAFRELGDERRATQWLARAIGAKPSYARARAELSAVYEASEAFDLAEELLRESVGANPGYAGGPLDLAAFLGRRGRWEDAESLFLDAWRGMSALQRAHVRMKRQDLAPLLARGRVKAALA